MTESEAKTMLEAYTECDRRKNDVAYEKNVMRIAIIANCVMHRGRLENIENL